MSDILVFDKDRIFDVLQCAMNLATAPSTLKEQAQYKLLVCIRQNSYMWNSVQYIGAGTVHSDYEYSYGGATQAYNSWMELIRRNSWFLMSKWENWK